MQQEILDFLDKESVCSLTVIIDDMPLSSSMHYSYNFENNELKLFFSTESTTKKASFLNNSESTNSSVVLGFSEVEWKTLQLTGELKQVSSENLQKVKDIHYAKHPESKVYENEPNTVFLEFIPSWYKYSNLSIKPEVVYEME